jgi:hypothetical protein
MQKIIISYFFLITYPQAHYVQFFKIYFLQKCLLKTYFASIISVRSTPYEKREGSGSGSVPLTNGFGSWRPKNTQILRIRIANTSPSFPSRRTNIVHGLAKAIEKVERLLKKLYAHEGDWHFQCMGQISEMENISRSPTIRDFVTILLKGSMQDNTVARLQNTKVQTPLFPLF